MALKKVFEKTDHDVNIDDLMASRYVVLNLLNLHLKHKPQKEFDVVFVFLAVVYMLRNCPANWTYCKQKLQTQKTVGGGKSPDIVHPLATISGINHGIRQ
ncbi:uncharacterized protein LOC130826061 isoform X3 [Amaranthus tricolor]|uniref:uncharacterized protein LOC130826061 isoform X3 n=1 Tax=Amaranthus tricolor TaxID=29722 RepID=UPI0025881042|nr:uncharacterized protein LOC130826061 isoform X3 [Amaranthus tricolor]